MVPLFTLRRRHVADRLEEPPIVEPIHSFEWRSATRLAVEAWRYIRTEAAP